MAPGTAGTEHSVDKEEIFHALLGQAEITLGTDHCVLHAGDTFVVPPGKTFALSNLSDKTFEAIAIAPAGVRAHMPSGEPFAPPWTL
jgi:quercetin dioxygenase-like cupin family protein